MTTLETQKRLAKIMLGVDPDTITEVKPVLSKTPVIDGVLLRGVRWSNVIISTGDRLGYCEATPGVLYVLGSASH
jgi:hypothetical protein